MSHESHVKNSLNEQLIDPFNRVIRYLRLSVTDRCNLRCTYCMSEDMVFSPKARILSIEEMVLIGRAFGELGVEKIRLTGGEPLVRNGIVGLAKALNSIESLKELVMTSNGVLLDKFAQPLVDAGVSRINISIDSLRAERFKALTRFGCLDDVLRGIRAAQKAGFAKIKLNVVVLKGKNDDEVVELTQYAVDNGLDISFIEEMPLGEIDAYSRLDTAIDNRSIKDKLSEHFTLQALGHIDPTSGPARYLKIANSDSKVGFISPMSNNFCGSCNRVRVTAEGLLLLCLGNEHSLDLREIVRGDSTQLKAAIIASMQNKPERHYFDPKDITITRHMSVTGG